MFKRYRFEWATEPDALIQHEVVFYVYRKRLRKGFAIRAAVVGTLPRLDYYSHDLEQFRRNSERLEKARITTIRHVPGGVPLLEPWQGKTALCRLWERLAKLPFTDMLEIHNGNPFDTDEEPECESLVTPEEIFD